MSHFTSFKSFSAKLVVFAGLLATAACASRAATAPAAAPSAATMPAEGAGVAEQQPPPGDDFVFVTKERKEAPARDVVAPATSLHVDETARKQRLAH